MAVVCSRPPPLPPTRRNSQLSSFGKLKKLNGTNNHNLSSTYLSFRDASDDGIFVKPKLERFHSFSKDKFCKPLLCSNSLKRSKVRQKSNLTRSQSEGHLEKDEEDETSMAISKYMRALSGSWKNLLNLGGMSRPPKPAATAKKVAPPAVPQEFRHSGSSFGSAGYASSEETGFMAGADQTNLTRDDHSDYGSTVSSSTGKSPGAIYPNPTFTFPSQPHGTLLNHKLAVFYHQQCSLQEDQGICDMTQSPGRDSPGSSSGSAGSGSRHSTASLDSGRASYHPLSTTGRSTIGSSNSPRCSLSSCSLGSEQGRIDRMISQGLPDHEIIHSWLIDLQFEDYYSLFTQAGYDLPTMCRMTPEDLTAIGIKNPIHRKRLKAEIAKLNLPDNLPEYIPDSLEEWLSLLQLDEYLPAFVQQKYQTVEHVAELTWEDLEEFGIVKLGHQKKIMLAIKRIKDIKAGKRINPDINRVCSTQDVMVHVPLGPPSPGVPTVHSTFHSFHQPWEIDQTCQLSGTATPHYMQMYRTDIVPIKIRTVRGKSLESLEDPNERTHHTFNPENMQTFYYQQPIGWRQWSYDDGDITPTNETALLYEVGGTLPRPRGVIKPRPIAKITANKARDTFPDFEKPQFHPESYIGTQYKTLPRDLINTNKFHMQYSPVLDKKIPPNPPKRQDSECNEQTTTVEIHHVQTSSPLPLPAYPSSDSLSISLDSQNDLPLPPPPAPSTPPNVVHLKLNSSQSWGAEEQELLKTLALQHRNGSDASFKSSSSTESDSLPFANENAGTIRTRVNSRSIDYSPVTVRAPLPPHPSPTPNRQQTVVRNQRSEPVDVLNDIGNMLANLTDELDAMLEEEKRQQ